LIVPSIAVSTLEAMRHTNAGGERWADVLRLLGRLEFVGSHWVRTLIFPDVAHRMTAWRVLHTLHAAGLIWKVTVQPTKLPGAIRWPRGRALGVLPAIYGLTASGRAWLADHGAEPDAALLDTFVVRDHARPEVKPAQLVHDLLVVDWCVSMIDHARRCPLISGIRCQLEYVSAQDERGQAYQRFDALVALTFDVTLPESQRRPGWQIPWEDRVLPDEATQRTVRFACELDRGTEKLATLMEKAATYAQLTRVGHFDTTLGGPVLPVVVAPPGRRGAQIAREWAHGWPGGAGVVSSFQKAKHPQYGALWGVYYPMAASGTQPVDLLADMGLTLDEWQALVANWMPGAPA
jgi:hypothetical protein